MSWKYSRTRPFAEALSRKGFRLEQLEARRLLATFQGLGDLPGGAFFSEALGISDDGQVVVGRSQGQGDELQPFRWSEADGLVLLGTNSLAGGNARAASADGSVIAGAFFDASTGTYNAAQWENDVPAIVSETDSAAWNISNDGRFVVGWQSSSAADPQEAYLWDALSETASALGTLENGGYSRALAVSDDGQVAVGYASNAGGESPFVWSVDEGMTSLGFEGVGSAISSDGSVVVGWEKVVTKTSGKGKVLEFQWEAYRWTTVGQPEKIYLGDLPGSGAYGIDGSHAYAVSSDGLVVAGSAYSSRGAEAFIWDDAAGMRSLQEVLSQDFGLDLSGWQLTRVDGVSADGATFVGQGINPAGDTEAFIATLGPPGPGVSVTPTSGFETSEAGTTASFEVVLNTQPSANVTIALDSSDLTEGVADQISLTFTPADWNVPQTVVVTGVDDVESDGDVGYTISTAATSLDLDYDGIAVEDVLLTNLDDDGVPTSEVLYVYDIRFDSRRGGQDWRAVFEVRADSNLSGNSDAADAPAAGASITVLFNGEEFSGTTSGDGTYRTPWQHKLGGGDYRAEVLALVLADFVWDQALGEDDDDGNGLPDELLSL